MSTAAELVGVEGFAAAFTRHHAAVGVFLQRPRARGEQICFTTDHRTRAFAFVWGNRHGDVEAVDEADGVGRLVVVAVVEAELG